jgi:phosphatidyl-myo-inositol dimannoside synthase
MREISPRGKAEITAPPRIILLTHEYAPFRGGVGSYAEEMARALATSGAEVEVWTLGEPSSGEKGVRRFKGRHSLHFLSLWRWAWQVWRARHQLRGQRLVLASVGAHLIWMHLACFGAGRQVAVVPVFHGSEGLRFERNPWLHFFARRMLTRATTIAAASPHAARLLEASSLLFPGAKVELAACGVKQSMIAGALGMISAKRSESDSVVVLTMARLHPRKGQLDTLQALGQLPPQIKARVQYQLAGTGEESYRQLLLEEAQRQGVQCEFLGEISEEHLPALYAGCDLYVMSSRTQARSVEGFGMTYLEAGLFGKPVVGYRSGGVADAVWHEQTGLLVEEGDVVGLSQAVARLIESPELRKSLGAAGRSRALALRSETAASVLWGRTEAVFDL